MHPPHGGQFGPHMGHPHFDHPLISPPPFGYTHYGSPNFLGPYKGYPPINHPKKHYHYIENNDRIYEPRDDRFMERQNNYENMNYTEGNIRIQKQQYFDNSNTVLRARPGQKKNKKPEDKEEESAQPQETDDKPFLKKQTIKKEKQKMKKKIKKMKKMMMTMKKF